MTSDPDIRPCLQCDTVQRGTDSLSRNQLKTCLKFVTLATGQCLLKTELRTIWMPGLRTALTLPDAWHGFAS